MVCNRCNNIIKDNSEKCPHCGMPTRKPAPMMNNYSSVHGNQPQVKQDNSMKIVLIVMGSLGGLIFVVMLLVLLLSGTGTGSSYNEYDFENNFNSGNSFFDVTDDNFIPETTVASINPPQTTIPAQQATTIPADPSTTLVTQATKPCISEKEIIRLYTDANKIYQGWLDYGWAAKNIDYNDQIIVDNSRYCRVVSADYMSVDEIYNVCSMYFEKRVYENRVNSYYKMNNGKLYAIEGIGQGGGEFYESLALDINECTADYCRFTISCCNNNKSEYEYTNEIRNVNGKWIFVNDFYSNFTLYFNENIDWTY